MRILQVVMAFYPCQIWGGPPKNTLILSKSLQARGHDVHILTTNILDSNTRMSTQTVHRQYEGIPVTYLNTNWRGHRPNSIGFIWSTDIRTCRHLVRNFDVIHVQGYRHFLYFVIVFWARLYGVPVFLHPRGSFTTYSHDSGRKILKRLVDIVATRPSLKWVSHVITLSDEETRYAQILGFHRNRITKILNPYSPDFYPENHAQLASSFRIHFQISSQKKIVLFLARLHKGKGLDLLIEAMALTPDDAHLVIVGPDVGFGQEARELVQTHSLNNRTTFTGPLYDDEKFGAFAAADVYVLPSKSEGQPTTVIEACHTNTPIILTTHIEIAQHIHDVAGIAVEYDVMQLKEAICSIIYDPEKQLRFRQGTRIVLENFFSLERAIDLLELRYHQLMKDDKLQSANKT